MGLGEVGINWSLEKRGKRLLSLLPNIGNEIRCSTPHNKTERISTHQPGGVGLLFIGDIISFCWKGDKDFRGLGRWTSTIITGKENHVTRIIVSYVMLPTLLGEVGSVGQQYQCYIQINGIKASPRELFKSDL